MLQSLEKNFRADPENFDKVESFTGPQAHTHTHTHTYTHIHTAKPRTINLST